MVPGTSSTVSGLTTPASIAAAIVTTLFVDPGSNTSVSGLLCAVALDGAAGLAGMSGLAGTSGVVSLAGTAGVPATAGAAPSTLTIARMSPVRTSAVIAIPPFACVAAT